MVVSATLSNDRLGIAVILDAANGAGFVDPEVCTFLNLLLFSQKMAKGTI